MRRALSPMTGCSSFTRLVLRDPDVSSKLEVNSNTGLNGFLALSEKSLFRASTGQKVQFGLVKRSTNSPLAFLLLGILIFMSTESSLKIISFQRRDSSSTNFEGEEQRISPNLKEPKNATVMAVHNTCLLSSDQSEAAIWCPRIFSRGRVFPGIFRNLSVKVMILCSPYQRFYHEIRAVFAVQVINFVHVRQ